MNFVLFEEFNCFIVSNSLKVVRVVVKKLIKNFYKANQEPFKKVDTNRNKTIRDENIQKSTK